MIMTCKVAGFMESFDYVRLDRSYIGCHRTHQGDAALRASSLHSRFIETSSTMKSVKAIPLPVYHRTTWTHQQLLRRSVVMLNLAQKDKHGCHLSTLRIMNGARKVELWLVRKDGAP
jgi:hypothetical protein